MTNGKLIKKIYSIFSLTLYWKSLEKCEENGGGFRYILVQLIDNPANWRYETSLEKEAFQVHLSLVSFLFISGVD